jgi:hypothetical protein
MSYITDLAIALGILATINIVLVLSWGLVMKLRGKI